MHAPAGAADLLATTLAVRRADRRRDFTAALDRGEVDGAYIGTHGELTGLMQRVQFPDGEWLSAAEALRHRWPDWVIFAACVVGRIDPRAGEEPLGLPISCMLGGSSTIIAAVVNITGGRSDEREPATAKLFADVATALAGGQSPALSLRAAQLRYLKSSPFPTVADGLGAICMSTRVLGRPRAGVGASAPRRESGAVT